MPISNVDLSNYVLIGRYDLPEPTRTTAPANSLLAQEVSAVTYNWDTDTLFVVGDGGTSIVQVSKTGALISSMTLATGSSPQGTEFYDPEGLTYIGNGQFVMTEERDRQAVQFTYVADTTLTRANALTVDLGTFVQNIGLEGLTWDPQTGGFVFVKESGPQGIFQTNINFAAGTATNGSATTENSVNLFDPALMGLADIADVFALSNLTALNGQFDQSHLLVLSQEEGRIIEVDRNGVVYSSLSIVSNPGNPLTVPAQQHEGLTMDAAGNLYVVSENGGGDFDHPQLWVYAPSSVPNQAPTALALNNQVTSINENSSTTVWLKVADVAITDDGIGTNNLTVSGADAAFFEVDSNGLYIKAGTILDFETKSSYAVTVNVDDPTLGATPDAAANYALTILDIVNENPAQPVLYVSEVAPWSSGNSPVDLRADWFELTNTGSSAIDITGWKMDDNSNAFGSAVPLHGVTSIGAGESVIFLETATVGDLAAKSTAFINAWFGGTAPAGLRIGGYTGAGVGLSTAGDAVNIYNSSGVLQTNVSFGTSPAGPTFQTFNNAAGLNNTLISGLSAVGLNGGARAVNDANEIGSPGTVGKLFISEVAPWSSGSSPLSLRADWFEVTNSTAFAVNIAGWKMDDNSGSFAAAATLNGVTSIAAGESVIFIETATPGDLPAKAAAFLQTWFGNNPPVGLRIGSYTGAGVGLGTGGDAVNLYNASGALQASVSFGASPAGPLFSTFDNAAALNGVAISQLSANGVNAAFVATGDVNEVGSPGEITPVNDAPLAVDDSLSSTLENSGNRVISFASLTGNDKAGPANESGQILTIASVGNAVGGTVSILGTDVIFAPTLDFNGLASFTYTLQDNGASYGVNNFLTDTGAVNFTITAVNDGPSNFDDDLVGTVGDDVIDLLAGNDTFNGGDGNDQVQGGFGNDILIGGSGGDLLDGGAGTNTSSYATATAAVKAVLFENVYNLGDAAGDTYTNIQNLLGSNFGDELFGDANANLINGGAGSDVLFGMDGDDTLIGGGVSVGSYNQLWGGLGSDTASYAAETTAVTAYVEENWAYVGGVAANDLRDTFSSIENLVGGSAGDVLVGDVGANILEGGAGADQLYGRGGADVFVYRAFADSNIAGGYDTIADFVTGVDKIDLRAFATDAAHVDIRTANGATTLFVELTPGSFNAATDLAVAFIGTSAVTSADILF